MIHLHAQNALLPSGWSKDVRIGFTAAGIASIEEGVPPRPGDERHALVVPAMGNLHSHAFQRAMAGLAERRGHGADSFWSWREAMYRLALTITPEQMEIVATALYVEMLEAGFARVGEFHYLHHDADGRPYGNIAEMAERIGAAAAASGMNLTLLPVFYAHSGFGGQAPLAEQRRFINSLDSFHALLDGCVRIVGALDGGRLGIAPHSLRAATPDEFAQLPSMTAGPIHIHAAEQVREVEQCIAALGARPVQWIVENMPIDDRWCLIHATHMTPAEISGMASSGAVAGLCPITEANLGDGIFEATGFLKKGGHFGIGTDSNIDVSLCGELRQLEYSQRLNTLQRNVIASSGGGTGRMLYEQALLGGAKALQAEAGLHMGGPADIVALDISDVSHLEPDQILDCWVFARGVKVDSVWAGGVRRVKDGAHSLRPALRERFRETLRQLATG